MSHFLRYLKEAFWVREKVPLLGHVPVNFVAVAICVALGFGHPAFWLLGLMGETAFLWAMVGSSRFRRLVDAREAQKEARSEEGAQQTLISQLIPPHRGRYEELVRRLETVNDSYAKFAEGDPMAEENLNNLQTLESVYLRLLTARQHLSSPGRGGDEEALRERLAGLERELEEKRRGLSRSAQESKQATIELLRKRLTLFEKRSQALEEIDSDLTRIEAQFALAVDSASIRARPSEAKLDLDLASRMMTTPEYLDLGGSALAAEDSLWESET